MHWNHEFETGSIAYTQHDYMLLSSHMNVTATQISDNCCFDVVVEFVPLANSNIYIKDMKYWPLTCEFPPQKVNNIECACMSSLSLILLQVGE